MKTTTITECQIKALVVVLDANKAGCCCTDDTALQDCTDLLHKLEFANDGILRLSGRMRVIDIRHDDEE
jgi:hypothetical protein